MLTFDYEISKEDVLSKVTESQIISHYVGTNNLKKPICSPFREERTPSFTFKMFGDKIIWRDWGTGDFGDAFSFVQKWYSCSFYDALKHINDDLILNISNVQSLPISVVNNHEKASILTQRQTMNMTDYFYWSQFGISLKTINRFEVYPVRYVWINGKLSYTYRHKMPVYEYYINENTCQIYSPYSKKSNKFRYNGDNSTLLGANMLPLFGERLVLSKSLKDIMSLFELGISATSFVGETTFNEDVIKGLLKRFKEIVLLYDNDKVGREQSKKLHNIFGFQEFFTKEKNISDQIHANREEAYKFIQCLK